VSRTRHGASPASLDSLGAACVELIRIVVADDHPIVLGGLEQLFASESDFRVVGTASTGREALAAVRQHEPDVLVLDLRMPDQDGIDVLRELGNEHAVTRVVVLTASESDQVLEAIRMGVHGVVLKDMAMELLVRCVREVNTGNKWIEKALATRALDLLLIRRAGDLGGPAALTARELEVARLSSTGFSNKTVAMKLCITEGTVKLHLHHIYEKLGLEGRMALSQYMRNKGIV